MGQYKKLSYNFVIVIICVCTFFTGYSKGCSFVFADDTTDSWTQVTTNQQLVEAFKYYCKSRDVTIEGSVADGVTSFTTKTFNGIVNSLGIDVNVLQANLKYSTDANLGTKFLFNTFSIDAYNRIFAQFLQDNELSVGDTVNDKGLYDGYLYTDNEGNQCFVYICTSQNLQFDDNSTLLNKGSLLKYSYEYFDSLLSSTASGVTTNCYFSIGGSNKTRKAYNYNGSMIVDSKQTPVGNLLPRNILGNANYSGKSYKGGFTIQYNPSSNTYYLAHVTEREDGKIFLGMTDTITFSTDSPVACNIYITTNNQTINNNNYEGDTIINNEGDIINNNPDPDNPDLPDPDYTPAEDWDIDLPDLQIPNWILSGKENKFPFDIPFNVMYALTLLQAEPEAPHLEGTLDFGFTTWDYDLDLSEFDSVALICRNMEFLAFLTGLMLMTRRLIWG